MKYAEVIIGPPGSGKSTYVASKKDMLSHRSPFTVNLDPGNTNDAGFDYSICTVCSSEAYQHRYEVGPNMSTKAILEEFGSGFEEFFRENIDGTDHYVLFDFPGQIEFFISSEIPNTIIKHLKSNGYSVVVVSLIDLVFFSNETSRISSYLISALCLGLLEAAQVNVISKCDNWNKIGMDCALRDIADLCCLDGEQGKALFYKEAAMFAQNQGILPYEILDYENPLSTLALQVSIDIASGMFFDDDYFAAEKILKIPSRDEVFSVYECN
ncbi:putative ATP binding protein [Ordospora pajunii]|uniref:putative ATP binding protein n=1 Tax=Ordospora pajunii TaxID=3039483 RepID=UPI002952758E|nr:putative ATP binding protein [Ordospora pajunii]KAH9411201.1 putative ATP binding protein [Ordospora pajunii]